MRPILWDILVIFGAIPICASTVLIPVGIATSCGAPILKTLTPLLDTPDIRMDPTLLFQPSETRISSSMYEKECIYHDLFQAEIPATVYFSRKSQQKPWEPHEHCSTRDAVGFTTKFSFTRDLVLVFTEATTTNSTHLEALSPTKTMHSNLACNMYLFHSAFADDVLITPFQGLKSKSQNILTEQGFKISNPFCSYELVEAESRELAINTMEISKKVQTSIFNCTENIIKKFADKPVKFKMKEMCECQTRAINVDKEYILCSYNTAQVQVGHIKVMFLTHKTEYNDASMFLIWPFCPVVWFAVLITAILMPVIALSMTDQQSERKYHGRVVGLRGSTIFLVSSQVLVRLSTRIQNYRLCVVLGSWCLFNMILSIFYFASLVRVYARMPHPHTPATFDELIDSQYEMGIYDQGLYEMFNKSRHDSIGGQLFSLMNKMTTQDCVRRVWHSRFACVMPQADAAVIPNRRGAYPQDQETQLVVGKMKLGVMETFCTNPLESDDFFSKIKHLTSGGVMEKYGVISQYVARNSRGDSLLISRDIFNNKKIQWKPINNSHFEGLRYLLFAGAFVACVAIVIEALLAEFLAKVPVEYIFEVSSKGGGHHSSITAWQLIGTLSPFPYKVSTQCNPEGKLDNALLL